VAQASVALPRPGLRGDAQVVLTRRAGAEACRQVGENARPVSGVAEEMGVCWWTVMNAVVELGTPLVDDPNRVGQVRHLGVDETSLLKANRNDSTIYATGLVDLQAKVVIDLARRRACGSGRAAPGPASSGAVDLFADQRHQRHA
jgi:hypothetical protein